MFLTSKFFLTAVSISLWAFASVSAVGFAIKAFTASLISRLIPTFRVRRLIVCFARLIADLMIGTITSFSLSLFIQSKGDYRGKLAKCKGVT